MTFSVLLSVTNTVLFCSLQVGSLFCMNGYVNRSSRLQGIYEKDIYSNCTLYTENRSLIREINLHNM